MQDLKQETVVNTTPVFQKNLAAYKSGFPIICNEGGSRSSKSFSIVQLLCGIAKQEKGKRISMVSHSLPHIKRGIYRDFKAIMQEIGWWNEDQWRATDFVYTFSNGSYIELFGLEDEGKARGPGRDILFINEANLISKPLFDQLAMRTTGQIFLDWNPADFNSWVYEIADNPNNKRIHSTYKDNIHNLSRAQIEYIEHYQTLPDDFMWKVYGLGERGAAKELIYTQWGYYEDVKGGDVFYGLDFGYTNPTALVKVTHKDGNNYAEEILYQSSLTVPELINLLKQNIKGKFPIYADCAEPKTIEEIYRAGYNALPADKDVTEGIRKVKSLPLYVTRRSVNTIKELKSYKWKKDKNDRVLDEPVKFNDHACDAGRYGTFTHLHNPSSTYMIDAHGNVIKF
jgi:phage terminase large subunit